MNRKEKVVVCLLVLILFIHISLAQEEEERTFITLSSDKEVYEPGDAITVTATVTNPYDYEVTATIISLLQDAEREGTEYMNSDELELAAGETQETVVQSLMVTNDMLGGLYSTQTTIYVGDYIFSDLATFTLTGTKEHIWMSISVCRDADCEDTTKVFLLGERIYIVISTEPGDASTVMALKDEVYTDKTIKLENIPAGAYDFTVTATREGYLEIEVSDMFSVMEKQPEVTFVGKCDGDFQCDEGETPQNCPTDCAPDRSITEVEGDEEEGVDASILGAVAVLALLLAAAFVMLRRGGEKKRRKGGGSKFHP